MDKLLGIRVDRIITIRVKKLLRIRVAVLSTPRVQIRCRGGGGSSVRDIIHQQPRQQNRRPATRSQRRGRHLASQLLGTTTSREDISGQAAHPVSLLPRPPEPRFGLRVVFCCTCVRVCCCAGMIEAHRYPDMHRTSSSGVVALTASYCAYPLLRTGAALTAFLGSVLYFDTKKTYQQYFIRTQNTFAQKKV